MRSKFGFAALAVLAFASLAFATVTYTALSPADNSITTDTTPDFVFNATSDVNATLYCNLYLNSTLIGFNSTVGNGNMTTITPSPVLVEGNYTWNVNCTETNGTANGTFASVSRGLFIDTVPNITLISPANGSAQTGSAYNATFRLANDNSLANTDCVLIEDSTSTGANPSNSTLNTGSEYTLTDALASDGPHTWNVNCTESGVGTGFAATSFIIIKDSAAPSTPYLNSPANNSVITSSNFDFNWTTNDTIDASLKCDIVIDESVMWINLTGNNGTTVQSATSSNITQGVHNWSVTCRDDAGNSASSQAFNFTLDSAAPAITFLTPGPAKTMAINSTVNATFNLTYSYTEARPLMVNITLFNSTNSSIANATILLTVGGTNVTRTDTLANISGLSEGGYDIHINLFDQSGNTSVILQNRTFIDRSPPSMSISRTPSASEVTGGTSVNVSCTATDAIGNVTITITDPSGSTALTVTGQTSNTTITRSHTAPSSSGSKDIDCYGQDAAGNRALISSDYTVPSSSSGSSGSGSGGGGGGEGGAAISLVLNTWDIIKAGNASSWSGLLLTSGIISRIDLEVFSDAQFVQLTVSEISKPTNITFTEPGKAYQYYNIYAKNLQQSNIKSGKIYFQVLQSWLTANGFDADDIALYRWTGSSWQKLDTKKETSTAFIKKFSAITSGFSYFGIFAADSSGTTTTTTNETEEEPPPEIVAGTTQNETVNQSGAAGPPLEIPWTTVGIVGVVIIAAVGAYFGFKFLKGRKHIPSGPKRIIVRRV